MNYKKIAKFIKDARRMAIWNYGRMQYISDGAAVYPVYGMPKMNEMEMLNFLGLADKANMISTTVSDLPEFVINTTFENCGDDILEKTGPMIFKDGDLYRVFYTEEGAVIVKNVYLSVVESGAKDNMPIMHCLTNTGKGKAVALFIGFDLYAIVMPIRAENWHTEYLQLSTMLQLAKQQEVVDAINRLGDMANEAEG